MNGYRFYYLLIGYQPKRALTSPTLPLGRSLHLPTESTLTTQPLLPKSVYTIDLDDYEMALSLISILGVQSAREAAKANILSIKTLSRKCRNLP